jgi:hypothetical protein
MLEPRLRARVAVEHSVVGPVGHGLLEAPELTLEGDELGAAAEHVVAERDRPLTRRALVVERHPCPLLEHELAAIDARLGRDHPQQRGLPRAVPPGQGHAVAPLELERDVAEKRLAGHVLGEPGCDHDGHGV